MVSKSDSDRRGGWLIVIVVLALVAAAATAGVVALKGGSSSAGASVLLEPTGSIGTDPFTASVAIGPAVEFPGNVRAVTVAMRKTLPSDPKTHTLVATGTAPGLYGGSGDQHVCNPQQLVTFLTQHPDKVAAWASVLGIAPNGIAAYVESLTPVLLTSDTLVTNHGYRNGHATTLQSVLEAGTAVMVDATGTPRVKCNCGNPLTPPALINPTHYRGTAWPGYTPTQVTVVKGGTTTINITVINISTGDTYTQPVGAASGGEFVASSNANIFTSADGTAWTKTTSIPDYASGLVSANGKLLALANSVGQTIVWSVGQGGSTHIAILPGSSSSIAYGGGRWVLTTVQTTPSGYSDGSIYTSTDATNWTEAAVTVRTADYGAGSGNRVPVAYGDGMWLAVGSQPSDMYTSKDGLHWTLNGGHADYGYGLALGFGAGEWVLGTDAGTITSHDTVSWTAASHAGLRDRKIGAVAYGNGKWLAAGFPGDPGSTAKPTLFSSTDATSWTPAEQTLVPDALAFGGAPSTAGDASSPSTPTSTVQPSSGIENVDFRNYAYQDRACGNLSGTHPLVRLANGKYESSDGYSNPPGTPDCGMSIDDIQFVDVTGDGVKDAVITGSAFAENLKPWTLAWTTVFAATPNGPKNLGYFQGTAYPPYSATDGINLWSGVPGAVLCCAATYDKVTYQYSNGKMVQTAEATNIAPSEAPPPIVTMSGG